ncbi:MAG: cytochrome P460 family protein [Aulosira sp. ZfuVER01]|nr:cytochrome P460 family protein [Aulosira sp. ZfuVER01]MDZ7999581.1 cytochrome P460 family protein [Aulosira sp. DedVER01a]MDZ8053997.1 cytochrome P460 family protein [Aulosira sp. ZfuCHP01]
MESHSVAGVPPVVGSGVETPKTALPDHTTGSTWPPCADVPRLLQAPNPKALAPLPPTVPGISSLRPAPQIDRVGFPENYQNAFKLIYVVDRPDNQQVRVICGNDIAAAVKPGKTFPYGSVFVMEIYHAKQDANGNILKDEQGQYIREALTAIFVHRKEKGFGADYLSDRSGEWEYIGYRPDKTYLPNAAPGKTNACASCHLRQAGKAEDYVFRQE